MPFEKHDACADVQIIDRANGEVFVSPKRRKVAIVGFASNSLHLVPWFDPDFELWGLNQGYMHFHRQADRWFEMHMPEATADVRDPNYHQFLESCPIPVYMIDVRDSIPNSVRYPIEKAIGFLGMDYFMSSVAFMMILAAMEKFEEIHLYGINLAIGDEYFYEKPNAEFIIGYLRALGIRMVIPHASALLKQYRRYGYFVDARPNQSWKNLLNLRIQEYKARAEKAQAEFNTVVGALKEDEALIQIAEGIDAGADIVLMPQPPPPATS
jgi:hypothetical protein